MAAVQTTCARIGMVTGRGLMSAMRQRFPRWLLVLAALALLVANTFNLGADLSGMADAAELLTGVDSHVWIVAFAAGISWATIELHYAVIAEGLKWLALSLLAYVVAAVHLRPDWGALLSATVTPSLPRDRAAWGTLVAILGTTISPYLFFWQAAQEVEEEKARGRTSRRARVGASEKEIRDRNVDVGIGSFISNLVMYSIIVTTALTLHLKGATGVQSSAEVAHALEPLAGRFSTLLYTLGIVSTGLLAIPTLAGSAAYAVAEVFGWREGMDERPHRAPGFYMVLGLSVATGVALDFANLNPIRALYLSGIVNGVLAPFMLVAVIVVAADARIMQGQPSTRFDLALVGFTAAVMFAAAVGMIVL
jgi:Mn2+/Fe2+ NRAMP family transporter